MDESDTDEVSKKLLDRGCKRHLGFASNLFLVKRLASDHIHMLRERCTHKDFSGESV